MHAPIAMSAMLRGLPVYGQKPLTHDIWETRKLTEMARKKNLVTQMGIQIHSSAQYRMAVELIQTGAIGKSGKSTPGAVKNGETQLPCRTALIPFLRIYPGICGWVSCEERPYIGERWYHRATGGRGLISGPGHLRRYGLPHL